ncbi:MAG: hypothetical protein IPM08_12515 [Actinomycetales bacterium]|nr:hypothetical protein [Actinomycetales bacterium]
MVFTLDPILGDDSAQRAADAFVEQAAMSLVVLATVAEEGVTGMPAGDPASCSHMGGTLRRRAAGLAQAAYPLPADNATGRLAGAVCAQVDRAGRALQGYAQDLAEALATHERLAVRAAAAGLDVQGWRVVEPYGIVTVPTIQARREAAPIYKPPSTAATPAWVAPGPP